MSAVIAGLVVGALIAVAATAVERRSWRRRRWMEPPEPGPAMLETLTGHVDRLTAMLCDVRAKTPQLVPSWRQVEIIPTIDPAHLVELRMESTANGTGLQMVLSHNGYIIKHVMWDVAEPASEAGS